MSRHDEAARFASSRTSPWHSPRSAHHLGPSYGTAGTQLLSFIPWQEPEPCSHCPPIDPTGLFSLGCVCGGQLGSTSPFLLPWGETPLKHPPSRQGVELSQMLCCRYAAAYGFHLTGWASKIARIWGVPIHQLCLWRQEDPKALQMISIAIAQPCKCCGCLWGGAKRLLESPDHDNWRKKADVKKQG